MEEPAHMIDQRNGGNTEENRGQSKPKLTLIQPDPRHQEKVVARRVHPVGDAGPETPDIAEGDPHAPGFIQPKALAPQEEQAENETQADGQKDRTRHLTEAACPKRGMRTFLHHNAARLPSLGVYFH
jgi:hypothetical protein